MRQADKQTESLFCGRAGFYNIKLKRKGFYAPPCPIFKNKPSAPLNWIGGVFSKRHINRNEYDNLQCCYDIICSQIEAQINIPNSKSAGIETAIKELKDLFCNSFKRK